MPFSLRLDPETEALLRRLSHETGLSKSSVVREAVAHYAVSADEVRDEDGGFARLSPFIGAVRSGRGDLSIDTHAKYRARLRQKHRAKRTR